mgnify:CR=1 FL=1
MGQGLAQSRVELARGALVALEPGRARLRQGRSIDVRLDLVVGREGAVPLRVRRPEEADGVGPDAAGQDEGETDEGSKRHGFLLFFNRSVSLSCILRRHDHSELKQI